LGASSSVGPVPAMTRLYEFGATVEAATSTTE